jgi:hypothetical protein
VRHSAGPTRGLDCRDVSLISYASTRSALDDRRKTSYSTTARFSFSLEKEACIPRPMRRFPPSWTIEALDSGFKIVDANGQSLAYVYGHAGHQADMQTPAG